VKEGGRAAYGGERDEKRQKKKKRRKEKKNKKPHTKKRKRQKKREKKKTRQGYESWERVTGVGGDKKPKWRNISQMGGE